METRFVDELHSAIVGKKHIIWDWNGTLLDDVSHAIGVMNGLLSERRLPHLTRERYRQVFNFPVRGFCETLGFDFEKESFDQVCHKFVDQFMEGFRELPLVPEMKAVLFQLHTDGLSQSVLSATDQPNLDAMIHHFELKSVFSHVFGIDNKHAVSKVERGHELIRNTKFALSETVIIGDTLHDLEVANALGIDAVLISHGHQCQTRLRSHHSVVIV